MEITPHDINHGPTRATRGDRVASPSLERVLERVPSAFVVTRGPQHVVVSVNAAGHRLLATRGGPVVGRQMRELVAGPGAGALVALLDQAYRTGLVLRDRGVQPIDAGSAPWCCSVWPEVEAEGPVHLVAELRPTPEPDATLAMQRRITERLLLSTLRERDAATAAEASRARAEFLAAAGHRLAGSLDPAETEREVARTALPHPGAWCVVDLIDEQGAMHRLAVVHPDPLKQALANELDGIWVPHENEGFGAPAMVRDLRPAVIENDIEAVLAHPALEPVVRRVLIELGLGPLLTVPLVMRDRLAGALTFVGGERSYRYTEEDVELAEALALRNAMALENARLHAEAVSRRERAELASRAKSTYLGTLSHELRTPLNAIAGYVDLIEMGLRGPLTDLQRADLARIRLSQQHVVTLLTNILNLVRADEGGTQYRVAAVAADNAVEIVVDMLEPLIRQKRLTHEVVPCGTTAVASADPEKVTQILVNLVANAIKFTPPGGQLTISGDVSADAIHLHVADTGIGIAADECARIFEPFVQLQPGRAGGDAGMGLGLAISRALARGMGGDLTVRSAPGAGSTFTLTLPRAV